MLKLQVLAAILCSALPMLQLATHAIGMALKHSGSITA
jgi:hypothetical protein